MDYSAHLFQPRTYETSIAILAKAEGCTCRPAIYYDPQRDGADILHRPTCNWTGRYPLRWWIAYN